MPAPDAIPDLPQRIIDALDIEPEWIVGDRDGIDALGRVCGINADSLALWESRLTDEDRTAPGVLDFPQITSGFIVSGGSHRREA